MSCTDDTIEDMALCVLDAWRMDEREPTRDELVHRYGFPAALVEAHGDSAIAAGRRLYDMKEDEKQTVTHSPPRGTTFVAGGNGAAVPVRGRGA